MSGGDGGGGRVGVMELLVVVEGVVLAGRGWDGDGGMVVLTELVMGRVSVSDSGGSGGK